MSLKSLKFAEDEKLTLPAVPPSYLHINWLTSLVSDVEDYEIFFNPVLAISPVISTQIHTARVLTHGKDVKQKIEITFNTKDFDCTYLPGDTIGIYPSNSPYEVDEIIKCLDLKADPEQYFDIEVLKETTKKNASVPKHLPRRSNLKILFSNLIEIRSPIKKTFLRCLCNHTSDRLEKRRLEEMCSKEGSEDYNKYILSEQTSLLTLLQTFTSCKPPVDTLLEHLPPIKPRIYSVASSSLKHDKLLKIVVTVVENQAKRGICSGYLNDIVTNINDLGIPFEKLNISTDEETNTNFLYKVPIFFRQPNNFRYPTSPVVNQILIGAGSGIAPFLGFLEHKEAMKQAEVFDTWLFFGCRNANDYIYRKELEEYVSRSILNKLFVSFSRGPSCESPKYVQDSILKIKEEFVDFFITKEACIYICGDAKNMIKQVLDVIKLSLQQIKELSDSEIDTQMKEYSKNGRIITDSWV